jgi:ubiquinone/menaquinone biosynthesis C-methylase UbiE
MTWYKEWFNSENYIKVYKHRDESEAVRLVDLIVRNVNLKNNASVLDMSCGAGRHAIEFAKKGFTVTAVDLSQRLLKEAKKNAVTAGVNIEFVLSDILEFETESKFALAVNLFTSFGYFERDDENYEIIQKAYDVLQEDGYFVLDYFSKEYLIKNLIPTTVFSENGSKIIQNRALAGNRIVKKITIEKDDSNEEFYESVRLFTYEEIMEMIKKTGFKITSEFGDYFGTEYNLENSPRLIVIAKR